MSEALPREFVLVAACSRAPTAKNRNAAIVTAAEGTLDWERVLRIVSRHRVHGLVHQGLQDAGIVPPLAILNRLKASAAENLHANLLITAETLRLQRHFDAAGIPCVFFKGAPLAAELYNSLASRHMRDIDVLVEEAALDAAIATVEAAGFRLSQPRPPLRAKERRVWFLVYRDLEFLHTVSGVRLELHWRLTRNPYLFRPTFPELLPHCVDLGSGGAVRALAPDDLFAYLVAHGALDAWFRLKWLTDIDILLSLSDDGGEALYRAAEARGTARCAGQAILLCHRLFSTKISPSLLDTLRGSAIAQRLARLACRSLTSGGGETELKDIRFAWTAILLSHPRLGSGADFLKHEARLWMANYTDMTVLPLPDRLHFLYPALRFPLWIYRKAFRE
jgi:hypothetical protein